MADTYLTYHCIGCGKEFHTKAYYLDGWICLKCRSATKLSIRCSVCQKSFQVTWNTYRIKDPSIPWRCRTCNDQYRNSLYDAKSDEEKTAFVNKQKERSKAYWASLSEEERKKDSERRKKLWEERRKRKDDHILLAMKEGRQKWWDSLTEEEKKRQWQFMEDGRAKWWKSLSAEEKMKHMEHPHAGFTAWYNGLSPEEQLQFLSHARKGNHAFWEQMTPEAYQEWRAKFNMGYRAYLERIGPYNSCMIPNHNESDFMNDLNKDQIRYTFQCPSVTIHPDFNTLFPINPVSGATFIDATHMWDFMIHLRDQDLFVDVDGSMHAKDTYTKFNPYSGITYRELDYKRFCDSQRPYQTDGLDAYAILCYDDHLTDATPVLNVVTGEKISYREFKAMLHWMNLTDEERRTIVRNS